MTSEALVQASSLYGQIDEGWIDCYPKSELKGTLFCGGVNDAREIEGNAKLQEAYEMGKNV